MKKKLDHKEKKAALGDFLSNFEEASDTGERISRPMITVRRFDRHAALMLVSASLFIAVVYLIYSTLTMSSQVETGKLVAETNHWYAIKLIDGDIIYGKVDDTSKDPLTVNPVYYNYDQKKEADKKKTANETGDIRLVRRGQETHGPDGAVQIFKSQTVFLENLRDDSKVLKVIQDNEKK